MFACFILRNMIGGDKFRNLQPCLDPAGKSDKLLVPGIGDLFNVLAERDLTGGGGWFVRREGAGIRN